MISVQFHINLKDRHFVVGGSRNLKLSTNTCFGVRFQKAVFSSFLLFLSVCYQDDLSKKNEIASSTARKFNNSRLLYVNFLETVKLCRNIWLIENWECELFFSFFFEIKGAIKDKIFSFLNGRFSVMRGPMDMFFWPVFRDLLEASNKYNFAFFVSRHSKSYNNLNVRKCLKLNDP